MKYFQVLVLAFASVSISVAEPPLGGYNSGAASGEFGFGINNFGGSGSPSGNAGFLSGSSGIGFDDNLLNGGNVRNGPQVRKYVSVHIAPEEGISQEARVIRVPSNQDRHVNIIFVKPPSGSSAQQTEVILPEQPQQRNLVYVLVKKVEAENNIKIRGSSPTSPSKPEVYFVRYKNSEGASNVDSNEPGIFSSSGGIGSFGTLGSSSINQGYSKK